MNDKQSRKLNMAVATQEVLEEHDTVWNGYPAIVTRKTALDDAITEIEEQLNIQETDITGNATSKTSKKRAMTKLAIEIAKPLSAYARDIDDDDLLAEVDFEFSDIFRAKASVAKDFAQFIHDKANALIGSLGAYPINAGEITDLQTKIDALSASIPKPRVAIVEREAATTALEEGFFTLDDELAEMDELIRPFDTIPEFFNAYTDARKLVNTGGRKILLRVLVVDDINDSAIIGAEVTATAVASPRIGGTAEVTEKTGSTGKGNFKDLTPGSYDIVVKIGGYQDATIQNIAVAADDMKLVEVRMVRV